MTMGIQMIQQALANRMARPPAWRQQDYMAQAEQQLQQSEDPLDQLQQRQQQGDLQAQQQQEQMIAPPQQQGPVPTAQPEAAPMGGTDSIVGALMAKEKAKTQQALAGMVTPEMLGASDEVRRATAEFERLNQTHAPGGLWGLGESIYDRFKQKERLKPVLAAAQKEEGLQADAQNKVLEKKEADRKLVASGVKAAALKMGVDAETGTYLGDIAYGDPAQVDNIMTHIMTAKPDNRTAEQKDLANRFDQFQNNPAVRKAVEGLGSQKLANEWMLTGDFGGKGMSLQVSPDGTVTMTEGGQPILGGVTTGTQTDQENTMRNADRTFDQIQTIMDLGNPDYLTYAGSLKQAAGKQLDKAGVSNELTKFNAAASAWKRQVGQRVLQYRKWATGVAGSTQEFERIENLVANQNLGPQEFEAAINQEIKTAQIDANRILREKGENEIEWPDRWVTFGAKEEANQSDYEAYKAQRDAKQ